VISKFLRRKIMPKAVASYSVLFGLALYLCTGNALAGGKSADEVAKELANPAGSLASLSFNLQYTEFSGDLNDADDQDTTALTFQPVLPFPVGDKGRRVIFRPLLTLAFDQPVFDPVGNDFDTADTGLGDTTFDLVYAGTTMKDKHNGFLWGVGLAGTLPTATNDDLTGDQWRFGPELFGGIIRKWGIAGSLVSNQWDTGGSNDEAFSTTTAQYFYAYTLGSGWQIAASPVIVYDWQAEDSDDALTLPLGVGLAKTTKIGSQPCKFQLQVQKFVIQPDSFGPDWLVKLTVTPVIKNPFLGFF
jgi:hypothetical protein